MMSNTSTEAGTPQMGKKWYVIQTYSGYENKVKAALQERIKQFAMEAKFGEILIPTETVSEARAGGKSRVRQKNSFPGYIFVEMEMTEPVWHLVKDTPKVTGFIGNQTPQEVKPPQIEELRKGIVEGAVKPKPRFSFEEGDEVRVIDGAFQIFRGRSKRSNQKSRSSRSRCRSSGGRRPSSSSLVRWRSVREKDHWLHQASASGGQGQPFASGRARARSARRQHHGLLQGVQRQERGAG